jgi:hypothetical protein
MNEADRCETSRKKKIAKEARKPGKNDEAEFFSFPGFLASLESLFLKPKVHQRFPKELSHCVPVERV